ncbi:protein-methionine sulfoxide oxidase mical2b isoform X2 [Thalassophryne amazonica]|uniref:protein-methionine sulfoxide oxidase mical2b isoform X2 n=1 Tax=Thalassophryne amazonica TaxID=390379 RepID=UPI0014712B9A|nr:protein-methionine sulfoxide oxidase mical2b isoform X2 [Thalassophryne amazonica]
MGETEDERTSQAGQLFENFVQASTCKGTLQAFGILCRQLELDPLDYSNFYRTLKVAVSSWKVKALWTKLDKRAQHKVYNQSQACQGTRCLIIGGGPCGLRTAIELALLGCKVVVIEKRDTFSRHNVLHLWPFTIHDLRGLGAKKFYGKFCAGSIDHISIRQLQLMLLKVCLILGVEIHVNVEFVQLVEPPEEQTDDSPGWRAEVQPSDHPVSEFDFEVVIGADGRKSTLKGFSRKEFRGKLAIAITANFVNRNTTAEVKVEEISGVAFIFNQKFFLELKEETGIDLENIVYYKDHTHYFVMTAKKQSLLDKGVIINDCIETEHLLSNDNVSQEALLSYAREAADFGTNYQLPSLDYAINHYGQPDVAMFDFTSMYASENAALIREKHGHQLLVALVGDSLLEPFWPMGTGCARGFLAAFDTAWMIRGWVQSRSPLEILAERESIYRLLHQTTPENISKNFDQYTIDPGTRYPNLNSSCVRPHQVRHLLIDGQEDLYHLEKGGPTRRSVNLSRKESEVRPGRLLTWCQKQTQGYRGVDVTNLTSSWKNGLALCALIHRQRPELIDFDSFNEEDVSRNNQLAFDIAEREFGIQPVTTGKEMAAEVEPDKLLMVLYLSKFYEAFRNSPGNNHGTRDLDENGDEHLTKNNHSVLNLLQPRKRIPRDDKKLEDDSANKRRRKGNHYLTEISCHSAPPAGEDGELRENKVRSMASQLQAKFEENSSTTKLRNKVEPSTSSPPSLSSFRSPSVSQTSSSYSVVQPLSDPAGHTCSSSLSPNISGSKIQNDSSIPLLYIETSEKTSRLPSLSHANDGQMTSSPSDESCQRRQEVSSSRPLPLPHEGTCERRDDLSNGGVQISVEQERETETLSSDVTAESTQVKYVGSCALHNPRRITKTLVAHSESFSAGAPNYIKERTVGKVSSAIDAKAQILAILYETDHRPSAMPCSVRKDFPPGLGGSDICHFCSKRVYVMERLSAGGYFFHRECFRCNVCNCTLRLGGHAFDSQEGKFYCKMHYAQWQSSAHLSRVRRRTNNQTGVTPSLRQSGKYLTAGGVQIQPAAGTSSLLSEKVVRGMKGDRDDTEMAVEALETSCVENPSVKGNMEEENQSQDGAKEHLKSRQNNRWKRKLQATFPLVFVKRFQKSWTLDREEPETVPEADCDVEIASANKQSKLGDGSKTSADNPSPPESSDRTEEPSVCSSISQKKRLTIKLSDKEKLLNWDVQETFDAKTAQQPKNQVAPAETEADKPQLHSGQEEEVAQIQTSASPLSAFQLIANAFRRTFSVTNPSSGASATASMRTKGVGPHKPRPMSEGTFKLGPLFSTLPPDPFKEEKKSAKRDSNPWCASLGTDPWGSGHDLPSLLQQVSLQTRKSSGGVFVDDMASLPRRRLDLFSSLRLRKREGSESKGKEQKVQKEIRTILTNLRKKAASQQNLEELSSTDDENENPPSSQKVCTERQRRKQEKTAAQQAKREQLKRLHRAQVIQRQLEEVGEKQRDLEERGVAIEKVLRGESDGAQPDDAEEAQLYQSWFKLVLEKDRLGRYESELMIFAQELQLEDTQGRLQQDLRRRMAKDDTKKSESELQEEQEILAEIMRTVEKRDMLVSVLEEQRLKEKAEDRDLESLVLSKGYEFHWTPGDESWSEPEQGGVEGVTF